MAKHYKSVVRCGFCTVAGYSTADCPRKEDPTSYRCVACKGKGNHTAWAKDCPVRSKRVEDARQAYLTRPTRFQDRTTTTGTRTRAPAATAARTTSPILIPSIEIEGTETAVPQIAKKTLEAEKTAESDEEARPRKRGRPTVQQILSRPVQGSQDIRTAFISSAPQNK